MHIALLTCSELPTLHYDDQPLIAASKRHNITISPVIWDKPGETWDKYDAVLLRSPWDYYLRLPEFLVWVDHVAAQTCLFNSAASARTTPPAPSPERAFGTGRKTLL
jgi:hypothetical protein